MNTHTKGPWKFWNGHTIENVEFNCILPTNEHEGWYAKSIDVCDENEIIIADVKAMTTGYFLKDFGQWAANAKLIVAAPEMYEVLSYVENMLGYKNDQNQLTADDFDVYHQVQNVLKKAKGILPEEKVFESEAMEFEL